MRYYELPIVVFDQVGFDERKKVDADAKPEFIVSDSMFDLDMIAGMYRVREVTRLILKGGMQADIALPYETMRDIWRGTTLSPGFLNPPANTKINEPRTGKCGDELPPLPTEDDIDRLIRGED